MKIHAIASKRTLSLDVRSKAFKVLIFPTMPRFYASSPSQELIPRITNSFNTRALTRNDSFTTLAAFKSTAGGIDAKLSTKLNKSVMTVGRRVDAARTSFSSVTKAINDPKLDICKDVALLKEWDGIEKVRRDRYQISDRT